MGTGPVPNVHPPERRDGRLYLGVSSGPGPNNAPNMGHSSAYLVYGGGLGDEGISDSEWASITSAAKVSTFAMAQAINATAAAPWWARAVAAATATGMLTAMRDGVKARYAAWDGVSLASPWVTA